MFSDCTAMKMATVDFICMIRKMRKQSFEMPYSSTVPSNQPAKVFDGVPRSFPIAVWSCVHLLCATTLIPAARITSIFLFNLSLMIFSSDWLPWLSISNRASIALNRREHALHCQWWCLNFECLKRQYYNSTDQFLIISDDGMMEWMLEARSW